MLIQALLLLLFSLHIQLSLFKCFYILKTMVHTHPKAGLYVVFFIVTCCTSAHVVNHRIHYLLGSTYLQENIPDPLMHFCTCLNTLMTVY